MEQPLPKNGACNLGSINLSEFVIKPYTDEAHFDFINFEKAVKIAVSGLDEVINYGYKHHALEEQKQMSYDYRNIGLGIMGLSSMLFKLGLKYGSNESLNTMDLIMSKMFRTAVFKSNKLAKEKGSFPAYKDIVFESEIIKNHFTKDEIKKLKVDGLRNCSLLSIAPAGSIATMLNVTTGCEPAFRVSYQRKTESLHKNKEVFYDVYIQEAKEYQKINNTETLPDYFIGADDIYYKDRIKLQAILQNHVDTAISATINLPKDFKLEDVEQLYLESWKQGLKGVTIFRDGCLRMGILSSGDADRDDDNNDGKIKRGEWKEVAKDTEYHKRKIYIGCGKLNLFIGYSDDEQKIQDLYVVRSGNGGCERNLQGMVIAMSGMLRLGGNLLNIEKAFEGVGVCPSFVSQRAKGVKLNKGASCGTAILNEIKAFIKDKKNNDTKKIVKNNIKLNNSEDKKEFKEQEKEDFYECPECGEKSLKFEGGCNVCTSCGYSKCS